MHVLFVVFLLSAGIARGTKLKLKQRWGSEASRSGGQGAATLSLKSLLSTAARGEGGASLVTDDALHRITSVECLRLKQQDPTITCRGDAPALTWQSSSFSGQLSPGNFPSYNDSSCNSNGEFFCDPQQALTPSERYRILTEMKGYRESVPVACGRLQHDPLNPWFWELFYLGVVVLKDWPAQESDPESLNRLGQIVMGQWNMEKLYVGVFRPYSRCPNAGLLIVLTKPQIAYLYTETCEFICPARGGPEVRTAATAGMRIKASGDSVNGVLLGIRTVYHFLNVTGRAQNAVVQGATYVATETSPGSGTVAGTKDISEWSNDGVQWTSVRQQDTNSSTILTLRILCGLAVGLLIFGLGMGTLLICYSGGHGDKRIHH